MFQWNLGARFKMDEQTENKSPKKSATRASAMAKVWEGRRQWAMAPTCCCGCDARLALAKNPEQQKLFKPGHDAALKSLLRKINRGEAKREDIPQEAWANLARIKFIQADPEFQRAFAKPSQPQRRQRKSASVDSLPSETSSQ